MTGGPGKRAEREEPTSPWIKRHYFACAIAVRAAIIVVSGTLTTMALLIAANVLVSSEYLPEDWVQWVLVAVFFAVMVSGYFMIGWLFAVVLLDTRRDLLMKYYLRKMQSAIKDLRKDQSNTFGLTYNMEQLNLLVLSHAKRYSGSNRYEGLFRSEILKRIDLGFCLIAATIRQRSSTTEHQLEPFGEATAKSVQSATNRKTLDYTALEEWAVRLQDLLLGYHGTAPRGRSMENLLDFFEKTTTHVRGYLSETTFSEISEANDSRHAFRAQSTRETRTLMKDIVLVLLGALAISILNHIYP